MNKALKIHHVQSGRGKQVRHFRVPDGSEIEIEINGVIVASLLPLRDFGAVSIAVPSEEQAQGDEDADPFQVTVEVPTVTRQPTGPGSRIRAYAGPDAGQQDTFTNVNGRWYRDTDQGVARQNFYAWDELTVIEVLQDTSEPPKPSEGAEPEGVGAVVRTYCEACERKILSMKQMDGLWTCKCGDERPWEVILTAGKPEVVSAGTTLGEIDG